MNYLYIFQKKPNERQDSHFFLNLQIVFIPNHKMASHFVVLKPLPAILIVNPIWVFPMPSALGTPKSGF